MRPLQPIARCLRISPPRAPHTHKCADPLGELIVANGRLRDLLAENTAFREEVGMHTHTHTHTQPHTHTHTHTHNAHTHTHTHTHTTTHIRTHTQPHTHTHHQRERLALSLKEQEVRAETAESHISRFARSRALDHALAHRLAHTLTRSHAHTLAASHKSTAT